MENGHFVFWFHKEGEMHNYPKGQLKSSSILTASLWADFFLLHASTLREYHSMQKQRGGPSSCLLIKPNIQEICKMQTVAANLRWFYWWFFKFIIVWNRYAFSKNCTWNIEFGSFPGLTIYSMILSSDAGQRRDRSSKLARQLWEATADTAVCC